LRRRWPIVLVGIIFEGGLAGLAMLIGRLIGISPWTDLRWSLRSSLLGLAATLPMLLVFVLLIGSRLRPLVEIRRFLDDDVRPLLGSCTIAELALLSLAAGVGEEALFRGVAQAAIARQLGTPAGLMLASLLFGLLHPINPAYIVIAAAMGIYLGALWNGSGNLLVPIVAHAVYDFFALVYLLRFRSGD
jgi:membrane protease YdiL (CAAX protease family)